MKAAARHAAVALGLTTIAELWVVGPLVQPDHRALLHWSGSPIELFLPAGLDFVLLWLALTALLHAARRPGRWRRSLWLAILFSAPWIALKSWSFYSGDTPAHALSRSLLTAGVACFVLLQLLWRPVWDRAFERAVRVSTVALCCLAVSGAWLLAQVLRFGWDARHMNTVAAATHPLATASAHTGAKPRIIWIVFDALSYDQVFDHRFPGLHLPAFDRLAAQSTTFTDATPAGQLTERAMPALFTGQPIDLVRSSAEGTVWVRSRDNVNWRPFDQYNTVFEDARRQGYVTGAAGWHNAYCRMLPDVLDHCFWTYRMRLANGMSPDAGVLRNLMLPWQASLGFGSAQQFGSRMLEIPSIPQQDAQLHIEDMRDLTAASTKLLRDPAAGFVFLHLPVPHPLGIYSRTEHNFTTGPSSYVDNLALADRAMAQIRWILENSGQWDNSIVIVMGDHGWRTPFWENSEGWTAEDQEATQSRGYDERPVYMVKLPGQRRSLPIDRPYDAVHTRALFDGLLTGKFQSPESIAAWAATQPPPPTSPDPMTPLPLLRRYAH